MGDTCFLVEGQIKGKSFLVEGERKRKLFLAEGLIKGKTRPYPMPEQRHSVSAALVGREGIAMGATIISGAHNEQFSWAWGT